MNRVVGLLLLVTALFVAWRVVVSPEPYLMTLPDGFGSAPQEPARQVIPAVQLETEQLAPEQSCRNVAGGDLGTSPVFGHEDAAFVHASYWTKGEPVRNVLLEGSLFERPSGMSGRWWAYSNCREYALAQVTRHVEDSGEAWGDASPFTKVS